MKVREIADFVGGEVRGDADVEITSIAELTTATAGQLAFFEKAGEIPLTNASCVISASTNSTHRAANFAVIIVSNPRLAFAKAAAKLLPLELRNECHETAVMPPQQENNY